MLLTLQNLKDRIGITNSADDAKLTLLIQGVGARFGTFCDRNLERVVSLVEHHDSKLCVSLKTAPVETLALYYDISLAFPAGTLLVANTDYFLNPVSGFVQVMPYVLAWPMAFKAIVTGGFVSAGSSVGAGQTAIPDDITRAMLAQCEFEWRNHSEFGRQSISMQGQAISVAPYDLLPEVKLSLAPYKRITL